MSAVAPQTRTRWDAWQESPTSQRYLSVEARQAGYTVVYVHPHCREAFLALEGLMTVYGQLAGRRSCPALVQGLWRAWVTWTLRLAAYLRRRQQGQAGTCPPSPWEEVP